ncbi:GntR family transcriptional regulator [Maridesulfovibrio ferrireducens]|uniref:GntR family transcriptional regulator n=1 Tax=Maridesulfovibrio ferrireducens TaxID=246191 RepID=UPI001A1F82E9|nr:GntR family transcriptional regulator [Maridesulfovibrio ferrireducens]MBI9112317.1 GntR family transcriptional regulator [Maridesulfovibrio ferrireducens]
MNSEDRFKRRVLRDDVVEFIIEAILSGELMPGERVVETKISRDLQVSQGAVREALRDLKARGFVESEPYKGSRVKVMSLADLQDYYKVRLELEPLAVKWAIEKDSLKIEELRSIVDGMYKGARFGDQLMILKNDVKFHKRIIDFAENEYLHRAWNSLANDYWIYMGVDAEIKKFPALIEQAEKHQLVVDAIAEGNLELVKMRLENHFLDLKSDHSIENNNLDESLESC